jgi:hypothetical protein
MVLIYHACSDTERLPLYPSIDSVAIYTFICYNNHMNVPVTGEQTALLPGTLPPQATLEATPTISSSLDVATDPSVEPAKNGLFRRLAIGLGFALYPPQIMDEMITAKGQTRTEQSLVANFPAMLGRVSFEDSLHMDMAENGQPRKIPRTIDRYRLAPIMPPRSMSADKTASRAKEFCVLPNDVRAEYPNSSTDKPFMDTLLGTGLVYDDRLVAVAGACVGVLRIGKTRHDALTIKQLQAVHAKPVTPKDKFKTGLHSGILWRDTLVQTWQGIAEELGIGHLVIQGAVNNHWTDPERADYPRFVAGYDQVAERNGFVPLSTGNWHKRLS